MMVYENFFLEYLEEIRECVKNNTVENIWYGDPNYLLSFPHLIKIALIITDFLTDFTTEIALSPKGSGLVT